MEVITGPFRPALEEAFIETFARLRREDRLAPMAVVASSGRLAEWLQELALRALPEGFAGVRFFNLFSFARTLYEEAAPGFRIVLDDLFPSRLVAAILRRHFADAPYLSRLLHAPGALLGILHELKAAAVRPDDALALLASGDLGPEDAPKLAEIFSLYKRYAEELRRRKVHVRPDVVRVAAEHAPRSAWLGSLRHVLYYGAYELDQNQVDLLGEVRRRVPVTLFFPCADRPEFAFARDFLKTLIAPMARVVREAPGVPPGPRLDLLSASGARDEVWAAAKEILRWADRGIPYDRIGVVARTLDPYLEDVDSIFREHRIPYVSSARRRLSGDPRVRAARLLFSLEDFDRARVLDLLRSPFFRRRGGDPELWDRASRLMGIGRGAGEWRRRLGGAAGKEYVCRRGERVEEILFRLPEEEVNLFWESVRELLEAPPPPGTGWKDFASWALERLRRFLEPDLRIEAAVADLEGLEGLALDEPLAVLLERFEELTAPAGGRAGVRVLDAMAARGLSFEALVLLGLNERVFPRYILEDPFLRDAVRSRIEHRLGCRLTRKLAGYEEERMLFALLTGAAPEIVLTYQRSDEKGRLQIPSTFIAGRVPRAVPRRPSERLRQVPFSLLTPLEASLRTGQGEAVGRALGAEVEMLVAAKDFLRLLESRGGLTPADGRVDARGYWHAAAARGLSPTALERLAECPFRYFAGHLMGLEELEEPEAEETLQPLEIGQIYHEVLERLHRPGSPGDLEGELEAAFRRFEETRSVRYPVLWEVEKERLAAVLRSFVERDDHSVFRPAEVEVPLRLEMKLAVGGRRTVTFRGFADRLDRGPGGRFRVVDYKKGRGKYGVKMETGILGGTYLQAPLYFLMAAERVEGADLAHSEFVYCFLEEIPKGRPWTLTLEGTFWERRGEFEKRLGDLLETIPRGEFVIRPGRACGACEFGGMCRRSHLPTRLRAASAQRAAGDEEEDGA